VPLPSATEHTGLLLISSAKQGRRGIHLRDDDT
jgi:hypothetical protein